MKVAFTSDVYWPRINGVTVSTNIFLNELTKLGHRIHLWAPEYPIPENQKNLYHNDPRVTRLKSFGLFFSKEDRLPAPGQKGKFFKALDSFGPDLLHVQTEFTLSLMARKYAKKRRIPMIQTCHTYFEQYINYYLPFLPQEGAKKFARWLTYRLFRHADAIIAPTEPMKQVLISYGIACPITVVPTGIPEEDFKGVSKADERAHSKWLLQFPQMRDRKLLLYVGRVGQEKNMDFLLDAVEQIGKVQPQTLLVVAGNGPYLDTFKANVATRGLSDAVLCLGYVNHEELKHLYALADVFTFASVTETQGLVTIEAMMCGTPAVAVGKMGTKEVMAGDNGGFMVDEKVDAFAGAVLKLLTDPALYGAKSAEAKEYAKNWTASTMAKRIEVLYEQVVGQHRTGARP
ncbi:MAG TPA: glycosyltransferase [Spirochaetia bacterium]|nr:glycosyltransferase [Spirochaetia bacterium]